MNLQVKTRSGPAPSSGEQGSGIRVAGATVTYRNGLRALRDASFEIPTGTITALVGVNGSGKSTLFKAIMGFARLSRGEIAILGLSVPDALKKTSSPMCRRPKKSTGTSRCWSRTWS